MVIPFLNAASFFIGCYEILPMPIKYMTWFCPVFVLLFGLLRFIKE